MSVPLSIYVAFIIYLFYFYFNFKLRVRFSVTNFMRWITIFYLTIIKTNEPKLNAQSCLGRTAQQKLLTWRKIIARKWVLIYVEVRSHLGGMNQFSYKRFVFTRRIIPLCRDLTKVRRLTWVGWFFLYKPLLKIYFDDIKIDRWLKTTLVSKFALLFASW